MTRWLLVALVLAACSKKDDTGGRAPAGDTDDDDDDVDRGYMRKTRVESKLSLNRLGRDARTYFNAQARYPIGHVGPTPAKPCCDEPDHKCTVTAADWADPVWTALRFVPEGPFAFQYSYESDGKTFTAKAIGCGGKKSVTLQGASDKGNPTLSPMTSP